MARVVVLVGSVVLLCACGAVSSGNDSGAPGCGGGSGGGSGNGGDGLMTWLDGGVASCTSDSDCLTNFGETKGICASCGLDTAVCATGQCLCKRVNKPAATSCSNSCECASNACGAGSHLCCGAAGAGASGLACHSDCECASLYCQASGYCL